LKRTEPVPSNGVTAMQTLYGDIALALDGRSAPLREIAGFHQAAATMDLIFQAKEQVDS
jgi:hypothetical protein